MNNIPHGYEGIDNEEPKGLKSMGDDYAGYPDENATADFREADPLDDSDDAYRALQDRE